MSGRRPGSAPAPAVFQRQREAPGQPSLAGGVYRLETPCYPAGRALWPTAPDPVTAPSRSLVSGRLDTGQTSQVLVPQGRTSDNLPVPLRPLVRCTPAVGAWAMSDKQEPWSGCGRLVVP